LQPDVQFIYIWEDQQDFSVSDGITVVDVDGQDIKLGQLSTGLKVAHQFNADDAEIRPYVGGRLFWDFDNPGELEIDGSTTSTDEIRAAISLGLDVNTESTRISLEATYDGLFASDYDAIGGRLVFGHQF
jgi:outer membrane autotransporter protein